MVEKYKDINCISLNDNIKIILICGDIHGDFNLLVNKVCCQYELTDTLVIVAGDCGFGFEKPGYYDNVYNKNKKRLEESNNYIMMVRGNHDNPAYFSDELINYDRFMTVSDYSVIEASGHSILCIGGGISIDRQYRMDKEKSLKITHYHGPEKLKPRYYWSNEPVVFDIEKLNQISERFIIDTVVTHTAPHFCELRNKTGVEKFAEYDETLLNDVNDERQSMTNVYNKLVEDKHPLSHWFYGHFHKSHLEIIDGVYFKMLNCIECCELYCGNYN